MKIIKWIITLAIIIGGYIILSDMASPYLRIHSKEDQKVYGNTITFDITIINFSPRPKEINIGAGDNTDVVILVDKANPAKQITKEQAERTITLPPFSNQTIQRAVTLLPANGDRKIPQVLSITNTELPVIGGQHAVRASWGGHTSDQSTFGVR